MTKGFASARILERKMEPINNFRILQGVIPLAISHLAEDLFLVRGALTNLLPPLITLNSNADYIVKGYILIYIHFLSPPKHEI